MADTAKNRSADDLLMTIAGLPSLADERENFATLSDQRLRQIILGCTDLHKRGLALWYLIGTNRCPSPNLPHRQGNVDFAFEVLAEHGVAPSMMQIARQGFHKTGEMLAPLAALLTLMNGKPPRVLPLSSKLCFDCRAVDEPKPHGFWPAKNWVAFF